VEYPGLCTDNEVTSFGITGIGNHAGSAFHLIRQVEDLGGAFGMGQKEGFRMSRSSLFYLGNGQVVMDRTISLPIGNIPLGMLLGVLARFLSGVMKILREGSTELAT